MITSPVASDSDIQEFQELGSVERVILGGGGTDSPWWRGRRGSRMRVGGSRRGRTHRGGEGEEAVEGVWEGVEGPPWRSRIHSHASAPVE
eukprot:637078-Prorocentrum_minimum.AAC.1